MKWAAATANRDFGLFAKDARRPLNDKQIESLLAACLEIAEGRWDDQFPVDVFQTGSGTSSNMNANEVIANRAIELSGGDRFAVDKAIHPNDHVNMGQSTNDTFPTAIHVAVATAIEEDLVPALCWTSTLLSEKAFAWNKIIKIGRTHLADATPLALGQEIGGLAWQLAWRPTAGGAVPKPYSNCRWAARPWVAASTPIPSSATASANYWPKELEFPSSRPRTISRPTPNATAWSSVMGSYARWPPRSSTWPTISAGWAPVRDAVTTN